MESALPDPDFPGYSARPSPRDSAPAPTWPNRNNFVFDAAHETNR